MNTEQRIEEREAKRSAYMDHLQELRPTPAMIHAMEHGEHRVYQKLYSDLVAGTKDVAKAFDEAVAQRVQEERKVRANPALGAPYRGSRPTGSVYDHSSDSWINPPAVLPTDKEARKHVPLVTGLLEYFPDACAAVAALSYAANEQHNPGEPMHWAREKSNDHPDCLGRHLLERGTIDTDGQRHSAKVAWRALAMLQLEIEDAAHENGEG